MTFRIYVCLVTLALNVAACGRDGPQQPTAPSPTPALPPTISEPTFTLSGVVRAAGNVPVVGARVVALDDNQGQELTASSTTTDRNGYYSISGLTTSSIGNGPLVSASKPGYFADIKWSALTLDKQLNFELSPAMPQISLGETIQGRIGDALCASLGYGGGPGAPCERFALKVPSSGTLEVAFSSSEPMSNFFDVDVVKPDGTIGVYGAVTWGVRIPVEAGLIYTIRVASGPAREFELTTALH